MILTGRTLIWTYIVYFSIIIFLNFISCSFLNKWWKQLVIEPYSSIWRKWKITLLFLLIINGFFQTFMSTFMISIGRCGYGQNDATKLLLFFGYVCDFINFLDIGFELRTAFICHSGELTLLK